MKRFHRPGRKHETSPAVTAVGVKQETVGERPTFHSKSGAAADAASVVLSFTRVHAIVVKAAGRQLQDRHRVNKRRPAGAPLWDPGVVFVPGGLQGGRATDFTLQPERLAPLHKLSGGEFQHKLGWFWKPKHRHVSSWEQKIQLTLMG